MQNLDSSSPISDLGQNQNPLVLAVEDAPKEEETQTDVAGSLAVVRGTYKYLMRSQLETMLITPPEVQPSVILNSTILDALARVPAKPTARP
ncbi:hypothetical protein CCACVL1_04371 [Corchorus capsularis]|uniref:Uncharacterized protein n=1 Tax=Corchorus capsularis TaxID=210143 RepID=A0A1R3JTB4_COCAP|nr:hypothetical protein CCACVL1_04371 [Corchorus capsularis]